MKNTGALCVLLMSASSVLAQPAVAQPSVASSVEVIDRDDQEESDSGAYSGDGKERLRRIIEARRANPNDPSAGMRHPGYERYLGALVPESEVIRILLSVVDTYEEDLSAEDMIEIRAARQSLNVKSYANDDIADLCRYLWSLEGNYEPKQATARLIAEQLINLDQLEARALRDTFANVLLEISPEGRDYLSEKKLELHRKATMAQQNWIYVSEHHPDFLINSRLTFCSKI